MVSPPPVPSIVASQVPPQLLPVDHLYAQQTEGQEQEEVEVHEDDHHSWLGGSTAVKYLLAGGVAGAGKHVQPL